jgi:hypothetical protein
VSAKLERYRVGGAGALGAERPAGTPRVNAPARARLLALRAALRHPCCTMRPEVKCTSLHPSRMAVLVDVQIGPGLCVAYTYDFRSEALELCP